MSPYRHRKAIDPDIGLVEQLRGEDPTAAEALVDVYGDRGYRLALRITGNVSDAEEVVQDALLTVVRKIDTFRGEAAFGSWLYRIVANAAYQKVAGQRRRSEISFGEAHSVSFEDRPTLAMLNSCQSAGGGGPRTTADDGVLAGLGPRLGVARTVRGARRDTHLRHARRDQRCGSRHPRRDAECQRLRDTDAQRHSRGYRARHIECHEG